MSNEWLSSAKAAEYLGVTSRTLYRLIDGGDLRAYRVGRVIRLRREDVEAYVAAAQIEPGSLRHLYPSTDDGPGVSASPDDAANGVPGEANSDIS